MSQTRPEISPEILQVPSLVAPGVLHGFTTRRGGVSQPPFASLSFSSKWPEEREAVAENHRRLAARLRYDPERLYLVRQVHGAAGVEVVDQERSAVAEIEADFLVTAQPGVTVGIITADCVGVLLLDPEVPAVAAAHAGWRGLVAGVLAATVEGLEALGARRDRLRAALGPSIGPCCFEVGPEVVEAFRSAFPDAAAPLLVPYGPAPWQSPPPSSPSCNGGPPPSAGSRLSDRSHVDLWAATRLALERAGVGAERIIAPPGCTRCEADRFHSYRRDGPRMGQQIAVIGIHKN